jgi:hypothetical protein
MLDMIFYEITIILSYFVFAIGPRLSGGPMKREHSSSGALWRVNYEFPLDSN